VLLVAVGVAVLSTVVGTLAADLLGRSTGPMIILTASTLFVLGLVRRSR
jgi:ABC-type Mn2+/Zn2+ transport system permease subunit